MTPYQVSSEIYGGFFYSGITLTIFFLLQKSICGIVEKTRFIQMVLKRQF